MKMTLSHPYSAVDVILVMVDKLTRYDHFAASSHPYSAVDVAKVFLGNICMHHGLTDSIH